MPEKVYARCVELMEADLGAELVALDVDAGSCFGFNEVATSVWRLLMTPQSFGDLQSTLLAEYDVSTEQCVAELQQLLDDMIAKRLVRTI